MKPVLEKCGLTLEACKEIAAAAEAEATKNGWRVAIALVDDGGHLTYLARMDETQFGSNEAAVQKAYSAIAYKRPTKIWEDAVASGRNAVMGLPRAIPIEGGLPLVIGGKTVGAIGISGGKAAEDGLVAKAGAEALEKLLAKA